VLVPTIGSLPTIFLLAHSIWDWLETVQFSLCRSWAGTRRHGFLPCDLLLLFFLDLFVGCQLGVSALLDHLTLVLIVLGLFFSVTFPVAPRIFSFSPSLVEVSFSLICFFSGVFLFFMSSMLTALFPVRFPLYYPVSRGPVFPPLLFSST